MVFLSSGLAFLKPPPPHEKKELARDISDIIKCSIGHTHEFHCYPHRKYNEKTTFTKVASSWRKKILSALHFSKLSHIETHARLDIDMYIDPIEIESPFSAEFKKTTGKEFADLESIVTPKNGDANLPQLRVKQDDPDQASAPDRACLRMRRLFSQKKDQCLLSYERKEKISQSFFVPITYAILIAIISYISADLYFHIGRKTSLMLTGLSGLAAFILIDLKIKTPTLKLVQRTIGYYHYASIYSRITESIYRKKGCKEFSCDTGNFKETIKILETRYLIENQELQERKYTFGLWFAVLTLIATLYKISIELDRITDATPLIHKQDISSALTSNPKNEPLINKSGTSQKEHHNNEAITSIKGLGKHP